MCVVITYLATIYTHPMCGGAMPIRLNRAAGEQPSVSSTSAATETTALAALLHEARTLHTLNGLTVHDSEDALYVLMKVSARGQRTPICVQHAHVIDAAVDAFERLFAAQKAQRLANDSKLWYILQVLRASESEQYMWQGQVVANGL